MDAEAIVSPANSFGFMDGGIDFIYSEFLGWDVGEHLRDLIFDRFMGELPVGNALALSLKVLKKTSPFKWLICAPTMRVPLNISDTVNAYLAFFATLRESSHYSIESILCPGLGVGIGKILYPVCAAQMLNAYERFNNPCMFPTLKDAYEQHKAITLGRSPVANLV